MKYRFVLQAALACSCLLFTISPVSGQSTSAVHIHDSVFDPQSITVHAGDTVVFSNDDSITHNVTGGPLKSGDLDAGKSWSYTFKDAGTYSYVCTYHSWMKGTITVR
jgi:plastocyanin